MKKLLLIILLFPFSSFAQDYSEIVEVSGKNMDKLYATAREWVAENFEAANELSMDDPIAGKIIGKGALTLKEGSINWVVELTLKISVKDEKYKCEITDIGVTSYVSMSGMPLVKNPFSMYYDNRENVKNGSDQEWLINNPPNGQKIGKQAAKQTAQANASIYALITNTDNKLKGILAKLQTKMKSTADNW